MRISSVDTIKGIAILFVLFFHSTSESGVELLHLIVTLIVPAFICCMGIGGYVSYSKSQFSLKNYIFRKAARYLPPWICCFVVIQIIMGGVNYGHWWYSLLLLLPVGGAGNYYLALVTQILVLIPILCYMARDYMKQMLIGSFLVSIISSAIFPLIFDGKTYQLLISPYMFLLVAGIYIGYCVVNKKEISNILYAASIAGLAYFIVSGGSNTFIQWLIAPSVIWILIKNDISSAPIAELGKASYNIYLVQLIWFTSGYFPITDVVIGVACCSIVGYCFYAAMNKKIQWGKSPLFQV